MILTDRYRYSLLLFLLFLPPAIIWVGGPLPQDPSYHRFADTRSLFGIPNFADVVSNLMFLLVAGWGARKLFRDRPVPGLALFLQAFLIGIFLTGLGSAWYHLDPTNITLFWDRLPMTLAFVGFFCLILGGCLDTATARRLFWPLTALGLTSVCYWLWTEQAGRGDLRFYASVQFGPALAVPAMLLFCRCPALDRRAAWFALACYGVAKVCELSDQKIFSLIGIVSGHTLKHGFAALGAWWVIGAGYDRNGRSAGTPLPKD